MIRVAVLLCASSVALAACHGGSRAVIVRSAAPIVPVCRDGSLPDTPGNARLCPPTASELRQASRRVAASRLRPSAQLVSNEMRWMEPASESARTAYIDALLNRRPAPPAEPRPGGAASAIAASMLVVPATADAPPALPFVPTGDLRGSLD